MSDHTYRVIEIVGSSPDSVDAAIRNAISRASETIRGLDWFEVRSASGWKARSRPYSATGWVSGTNGAPKSATGRYPRLRAAAAPRRISAAVATKPA
jgi:flavin-binding protein dodecin